MNNINKPNSIANIWKDIEKWYKVNTPNIFEDINSGVTQEELNELEQKIGVSFPEDYRESLKIHNGDFSISDYQYISQEIVFSTWQLMKELLEEGAFNDSQINNPEREIIQNTWWDINWIPFAKDSGGNKLCIDMNPGINGVKGQIIYHETHEGPIPSKYTSFLDWLESYKNDLYDGLYVVDEEGYIEPK